MSQVLKYREISECQVMLKCIRYLKVDQNKWSTTPRRRLRQLQPMRSGVHTETDASLWETVGQDVEEFNMTDEEDPQRSTAVFRESSQKFKTKKPTMKVSRRQKSTAASSADTAEEVKVMQEQMGHMQQMFLQMKEMMGLQRDLMQPATEEVENEVTHNKEKQKGGSSANRAASSGRKKTARQQLSAALTGREAPYPTLSTMFSDDLTWNIILSIKSQSVTFKWKMLLLMMRIKRAVEHEMDKDKGTKRRWKRNPRWIMLMHGRHLAALWGHLGSARQLCNNPKTWWLAQSETEPEREHRKRGY